MSGDRMKAVEITQDVFVWLMQHSRNFDPSRGELGAFLIGVTRKFLLRQQQHEQKWVPLDEASEVFEARLSAANAPDMDETAATWLREAIALLPGRYREVVVLCDLEGNTYESAAAMLECAVGTVRSRLHRARELLARKLHSRKESQRCAV
jgi:RNA polymerase sigma-70 factor (ECF subfamily)